MALRLWCLYKHHISHMWICAGIVSAVIALALVRDVGCTTTYCLVSWGEGRSVRLRKSLEIVRIFDAFPKNLALVQYLHTLKTPCSVLCTFVATTYVTCI